MGSLVSSHMDSVMQKNMDNMATMQRDMMERQIQMQNYMRERQMAMQIARQQELFYNWLLPSYSVLVPLCIMGYAKTKLPGVLVPVLPLSIMFGYQADMAYYNKLDRIREHASIILEEEPYRMDLPGKGLPTIDELDRRREQDKFKSSSLYKQ